MTPNFPSPLREQLLFLIELEKLKAVRRRNWTVDERNENSAEHSWHVAAMALVLHSHANSEIDLLKVLKMLLIHDVVEIDAGDTWAYAPATDQRTREHEAARRVFGLLPEPQRTEMLGLWHEFDAGQTEEARFANSVDAFQPLLNHLVTGSDDRDEPKPQLAAVLAKKQLIAASSAPLWDAAQRVAVMSADRGLYER